MARRPTDIFQYRHFPHTTLTWRILGIDGWARWTQRGHVTQHKQTSHRGSCRWIKRFRKADARMIHRPTSQRNKPDRSVQIKHPRGCGWAGGGWDEYVLGWMSGWSMEEMGAKAFGSGWAAGSNGAKLHGRRCIANAAEPDGHSN